MLQNGTVVARWYWWTEPTEELKLLSKASQIQSKQKEMVAAIGSKPVELLNGSCRCKNFTCIQGKAGKVLKETSVEGYYTDTTYQVQEILWAGRNHKLREYRSII